MDLSCVASLYCLGRNASRGKQPFASPESSGAYSGGNADLLESLGLRERASNSWEAQLRTDAPANRTQSAFLPGHHGTNHYQKKNDRNSNDGMPRHYSSLTISRAWPDRNFASTRSVSASQSRPAKGNVSRSASRISGSSSRCKIRRERSSRVFTVPVGMCNASAVSSTLRPSISRSTKT